MQRSFTRPNGACHRGDNEKSGKILVLPLGAEIGFEVDAQDCSPTDRSDRHQGERFRQRYSSEPSARARRESVVFGLALAGALGKIIRGRQQRHSGWHINPASIELPSAKQPELFDHSRFMPH
jgi:hypothetical protein